MSTKEELLKAVKEWITIDSEINEHLKQIKVLRGGKKNLTDTLLKVMKENNLDCFDTNESSLIHKKTKVKQQINSKSLMNILNKCDLLNGVDTEKMVNYIMENREEKITETIKRKNNK